MAREYNISKSDFLCHGCRKRLEPGCELVATVREVDQELQRLDFCTDCWSAREGQDDANLVGMWRSRVPAPEEKKKLLVDDELLVNLFERLTEADSQAKRDFRFVLALLLMRKKLLVYDRTEQTDSGDETWIMHLRGDATPVRVINPHLDDDKIAEVSGQFDQIIEGHP